MNSIPSSITISQSEYQRLLERDFFLTCLEGAGVDNWNGYDYAMEEYYDELGMTTDQNN